METRIKVLWKQVVEPLRELIPKEDFNTWILPMRPLSAHDGVLEIAVPNRLFASWVQENFYEELSKAWLTASGHQTDFHFVWEAHQAQGELFAEYKKNPLTSNESMATAPHTQPPTKNISTSSRSAHLIQRYDFTHFVVGPSNQFARAAALAVASQPGTLYNPFLLFGGVGLGKTHLVNAIGNAILEADPTTKVLCLSADSFTSRLIDAIARNKAQEFKNRMRRIDVLILDDVQFLAGRERTQQEFFHIFNALYENGKQIILTSDKFPNEIKGMEERLCNRFGSGLVADIQSPDVETRVAILERKAHDEGIDLPIEVASFMAGYIDSNIRDLEGALTRISAFASLNRCNITLALAHNLLETANPQAPRTISLEGIENNVSTHYGLKPGELRIRKRTRKVAEARQIAMYLMRHHGGASYPAIGEFLGGRDHSTVIHACRTIQKRCTADARFRAAVEALARRITCG